MRYWTIFLLLLIACAPPNLPAEPLLSCSLQGYVLSCPDGSKLTIQNGTNGKDSIPVQPVQFCPGIPTMYPTTFAEYGLCIDNQLFAVYWDGVNSWVSLVPPGTYRSTSSTAPCTFLVSVGCQVTRQ